MSTYACRLATAEAMHYRDGEVCHDCGYYLDDCACQPCVECGELTPPDERDEYGLCGNHDHEHDTKAYWKEVLEDERVQRQAEEKGILPYKVPTLRL